MIISFRSLIPSCLLSSFLPFLSSLLRSFVCSFLSSSLLRSFVCSFLPSFLPYFCPSVLSNPFFLPSFLSPSFDFFFSSSFIYLLYPSLLSSVIPFFSLPCLFLFLSHLLYLVSFSFMFPLFLLYSYLCSFPLFVNGFPSLCILFQYMQYNIHTHTVYMFFLVHPSLTCVWEGDDMHGNLSLFSFLPSLFLFLLSLMTEER